MKAEFRRQIIELIEMKKSVDQDMMLLKHKMANFNKQVEEVTGKKKLDYDELVMMICEEDAIDQLCPSEDVA